MKTVLSLLMALVPAALLAQGFGYTDIEHFDLQATLTASACPETTNAHPSNEPIAFAKDTGTLWHCDGGAWQQIGGPAGGGSVPWVSVIDEGADPTGVADSTAAFGNAAVTAGVGGAILVPPGEYSITTLDLDGASYVDQSWHCYGDATLVQADNQNAADQDLWLIDNTSGIKIYGCKLSRPDVDTTDSNSVLRVRSSSNVAFIGGAILDSPGYGFRSVNSSGSRFDLSTVRGVRFASVLFEANNGAVHTGGFAIGNDIDRTTYAGAGVVQEDGVGVLANNVGSEMNDVLINSNVVRIPATAAQQAECYVSYGDGANRASFNDNKCFGAAICLSSAQGAIDTAFNDNECYEVEEICWEAASSDSGTMDGGICHLENSPADARAISMDSAEDWVISNLVLYDDNSPTVNTWAIRFVGSGNIDHKVTNVTASGFYRGIDLAGNSGNTGAGDTFDVSVSSSQFTVRNRGVDRTSGEHSGSRIENNDFTISDVGGKCMDVGIGSAVALTVEEMMITGNRCRMTSTGTSHGIQVYDFSGGPATVNNITIRGNEVYGLDAGSGTAFLVNGSPDDVFFSADNWAVNAGTKYNWGSAKPLEWPEFSSAPATSNNIPQFYNTTTSTRCVLQGAGPAYEPVGGVGTC